VKTLLVLSCQLVASIPVTSLVISLVIYI